MQHHKLIDAYDAGYHPTEGATVLYWMGETSMTFIASPEQMAECLKRQGCIDGYVTRQGAVHVKYTVQLNGRDLPMHDSLDNFVNGFAKYNWMVFITEYEFSKNNNLITFQTNDYSINRYKNV